MRRSEPVGRFDAGRRPAFTDRAGLAVVGFVFAGVTAVVIATAALVVRSHVNAKSGVEQSSPAAVSISPSR